MKISKLESSLQLHQQHIKDQKYNFRKTQVIRRHMNKNNKDNGMLRKILLCQELRK